MTAGIKIKKPHSTDDVIEAETSGGNQEYTSSKQLET